MNCRRGGHESIDNLSTIRKNLSIRAIVKSDDLGLDYLAPKAEGWTGEQEVIPARDAKRNVSRDPV